MSGQRKITSERRLTLNQIVDAAVKIIGEGVARLEPTRPRSSAATAAGHPKRNYPNKIGRRHRRQLGQEKSGAVGTPRQWIKSGPENQSEHTPVSPTRPVASPPRADATP